MIKNNLYTIEKDKENLIFILNSATIDDSYFDAISNNFIRNKNIAFDMKQVRSITSKKFIKALLNKEIKLFNLKNEILVYLSIIIKNGPLNSYLCKKDFKVNKHEFIKRNFLIA